MALFSSVPLRVKLIAAVLALVSVALVFFGGVSDIAFRTYQIDRIDNQLRALVESIDATAVPNYATRTVLPSDYVLVYVMEDQPFFLINRPDSHRPVIPSGKRLRSLANTATTVSSQSSSERWRLLIQPRTNDRYLIVGASLADTDAAVDRLIAAELIIGIGILTILAIVGIGIIQASLKPLIGIERTAGAIAAGDLTRRVSESDPNTEVGRLANALNTMLAQIEGAFAARAASEERMRQFIADASHELRTPLTTVRGFAELYRHGAVETPERTADLMRRIESEAARMGLIVEDLLLLARLDCERPLTLAPVEVRALASDAVTAARVVDPDRRITLVTGDESVIAIGDESRLRQVLGNLMTNAIIHTPAGTPIAVRVWSQERTAVIEVSDAGPGLSADQRQRVFERFYRVDKARTKKAAGSATAVAPHSGSGLGLAIVAAIVSAHDGSVEVHSTPGEGATFAVRLPLLTDSHSPAEGSFDSSKP